MNFSSLNVVQLRVKLRTLGDLGRVDLELSQPEFPASAQKHLGNRLGEQKSDVTLLSEGQSQLYFMALAVVVIGTSPQSM